MKVLEDLHRYMSLLFSDRLSSQLQFNFDMKDVSCEQIAYKDYTQTLGSRGYMGLFRLKNRGFFVFIEPKIIYVLTNRCLGGQGITELKPKPILTFSEEFVGKKVLDMFTDFYKEAKLDTALTRIETNPSLVHFFYPEETVCMIKMGCRIDQNSIGSLSICYPTLILDKKESSWGTE